VRRAVAAGRGRPPAVRCTTVVVLAAIVAVLSAREAVLAAPAPQNATPPPGAAPGTGGAGGLTDADLADRPISSITISGLRTVDEQLVRNNIRGAIGDPFDPGVIAADADLLNRLAKFKQVDITADLQPDGTVALRYVLLEQPLIEEVQVVGNSLISDQDLRAVIRQIPGSQRDDFLIEQSKRNIVELYRERGNYLVSVEIDESELEESGILLFRVIEGPRVRIRAIEFEGNEAFPDKQLKAQIRTRTYLFLVRKGVLDQGVLDQDEAALDRFYRDRGFADVRIGRRVDLSPDDREAKITFLVDEGRRYTLGDVVARRAPSGVDPGGSLRVFGTEQLTALMTIKTGDVYSADKLRTSRWAIEDAYAILGYHDVSEPGAVRFVEHRPGPEPVIDLYITIDEGRRWTTGFIDVQGNFLTRDKVIRRELELTPGRPLDATELRRSEQKLAQTRLFGPRTRLVVQDPAGPDSADRDLLIEVAEQNTGSWSFAVSAGTDSGLFGEIALTQRNFDIADVPASLSELFTGRAFRGAGQRFNMTLRPGTELFQYFLSVTEPRIFDSDYSVTAGGNFSSRIFDQYDEQRFSGNLAVGRRFGELWSGRLGGRHENVEIRDIDASAPTEVFIDEGTNQITSLDLTLSRTTFDDPRRPGSGSRLELTLGRAGAFGGDYNYWTTGGEYTVYFTLDEDFLGRITTIRLRGAIQYAFDEDRVPVYERFYLGGRSLRGFEFRTVSPKGIRNDNGQPSEDPIGGLWSMFLGAQYEVPLFEDAFSGVIFVDSGTVLSEPGISDWRVGVGVGIRLTIPAFGPVPLAFDLGFPLVKEELDETQIFSFAAELPF